MPRRKYDYSDHWSYYERRSRIPADGIKAKNKQGAFGTSWWAKRWIGALESFGYGSRLTRGRTYARSGAVLNIDVAAGQVNAKVQGSRSTPYKVKLELAVLDATQWAQALDAIAEQAIFAAKLLAGEMPQNIEEAFEIAQVPLFPRKADDLKTNCSCPDFANPCKHIAAVHYLLGERFDEDPFLLFELRGRTQAQIIAALRERRSEGQYLAEEASVPAPESAPPLHELVANFDHFGPDAAQLTAQIAPPAIEAALLRRLGEPPGEIGNELRMAYGAITRMAVES
ncbi:SWIM zinc finger family protein [Candidatus Viridilinea mediisalina]|uniref:SWIM-type domain-containing protein n=1 Tax=Candidatus Viridilinea mediisalina TaxID=2024553 RepID=A0A2A6RM17_9CHLR|nr:SWIM zinc finger family protein [Candidatus Viridilinea mediisalina]PDW03946.1 hypothetical protein CJ255_06220 [Candidatus Viridilinea mediisalina]